MCVYLCMCDNMYHTYILCMIFKHLLRHQELRTSHWCFSLNSKAEPQVRLVGEWFTQAWTGKENLYVLPSWLLQGVNDCWIFGMLWKALWNALRNPDLRNGSGELMSAILWPLLSSVSPLNISSAELLGWAYICVWQFLQESAFA